MDHAQGTLTPVEDITSLQFTSPGTKKVPPVQMMDSTRRFSGTIRHVPVPDVVEPKVFSPHAKTMGHAPRRIEVERKKRMFASVDLNDALKRNGVVEHLVKEKESGVTDGMHLHLFDNTDFESRSNAC